MLVAMSTQTSRLEVLVMVMVMMLVMVMLMVMVIVIAPTQQPSQPHSSGQATSTRVCVTTVRARVGRLLFCGFCFCFFLDEIYLSESCLSGLLTTTDV